VAGVDLEHLLKEELAAHMTPDNPKVRISGPPVRLQAKAAETFGLAIHELAVNAVKYGALSEKAGQLEVTWRIRRASAANLSFDWHEKNGPPISGPVAHRGFGAELLGRTLAFELKADAALNYEPSGLHCVISLPLTPDVAMQELHGD